MWPSRRSFQVLRQEDTVSMLYMRMPLLLRFRLMGLEGTADGYNLAGMSFSAGDLARDR